LGGVSAMIDEVIDGVEANRSFFEKACGVAPGGWRGFVTRLTDAMNQADNTFFKAVD